MKKITIATLCAALVASTNHGYFNDPRLSPQKVSFLARAQRDSESLESFLLSLKEFLYEQGLYDAVYVITDIEKGLMEKHKPDQN